VQGLRRARFSDLSAHEFVRPGAGLGGLSATDSTALTSSFVSLIGYGGLTGEILVFNEIGNFKGETIADEMPAGDFLLYVQADGRWTLKFTP
jgi:hypothetical protein